jgi:hypothetical protein
VEKPRRVFARKHHADIAGRNPRRLGGVKFLALSKRCALVKGAIRSAHAGAEQRRCFDDEDAVQSTVPIVVGQQPKGHAGFIARDDGSRYCDDGHATTHLCAGRDKEACMGDELAAQEMLVKNWAQYSRARKTLRVGMTTQGGPNYEELISCLDSLRDADAVKKADPFFDLPDQEPKCAPSNRSKR